MLKLAPSLDVQRLLRLARSSSRPSKVKSLAFDIVEMCKKIKHSEAPWLNRHYQTHAASEANDTHVISFPVQHAVNETSVELNLPDKWHKWPRLIFQNHFQHLAEAMTTPLSCQRVGTVGSLHIQKSSNVPPQQIQRPAGETWDEKGTRRSHRMACHRNYLLSLNMYVIYCDIISEIFWNWYNTLSLGTWAIVNVFH